MKKRISILSIILISAVASAQVKIGGTDGTPNVNAMLDIEATNKGVLLPRVALSVTTLASPLSAHVAGMIVYNTATAGDVVPGQYYNDGTKWQRVLNPSDIGNFAGAKNTTVYSASKDGAWNLLSLGISGQSWNKINVTSTDTKVGNSALFSSGVYTVPSSGVYVVRYSVELDSGVDLGVLGDKKLVLIKNNAQLIEEKLFESVRVSVLGLGLVQVPLTSTSMETMVQLNTNDTVTFGVDSSTISLSALTDGKISLYIYKISNL
ncbi:hypothetical protein P3875_00400 [Myroides sp. JBRI-B21084]|uniref:hypothetical protein n=1 Tax=Myroides sp. JBRI-B21084 TaxID=3119977 RepID=UPI0026E37615|nr:hypothetical protein [Paenimyroides cloacae]WKW46574.1 hypothetical protein P3875_00400 [Paenimyroides cloacae]